MSEPARRPIAFEDAELVAKVQDGHVEAYGELVRKYVDRVYNTCWRICGHLEDARDLTQETFLKGFENIAQFKHQSAFYTWIFRVAVNLALSHRRSNSRRQTVSLDQACGAEDTQAQALARTVAAAEDPPPDCQLSDRELHGTVAAALWALDDDHRAVVVLRDIEGLDYLDISVVLGIPTGTVKSRLHRARTALRKAIEPDLARGREA